MIGKIIKSLEEYGLQNNEGSLTAEQIAELKAQIGYLENMRSFEELIKRIDMLQDALIEMGKTNEPKDMRVSRKDFVQIYNKCVSRMFDECDAQIEQTPYENMIYSNPMTIHWKGMYCNLSSGACIANNIIPGIEGVDEDEEGSEWNYEPKVKEKKNVKD